MSPQRLLQIALALFGAVFLLVYPLALVWPSGWAWHAGAPHDSQYFMMIVGVYATLGVFLLIASRDPQAHRSLIWFTVWSSVVHGGIMAVQSMPAAHHGHLFGDVPALFLVAIVLGGLLVSSDAGQGKGRSRCNEAAASPRTTAPELLRSRLKANSPSHSGSAEHQVVYVGNFESP
jgi:hypothetical protein